MRSIAKIMVKAFQRVFITKEESDEVRLWFLIRIGMRTLVEMPFLVPMTMTAFSIMRGF